MSKPSSSEKRIIIVMGPTGAGKTTFINYVAKLGDRGVGHDIESFTSQVQEIEVPGLVYGRRVVFVDTPGFDDTYQSDTEILTMIAEYLIATYKNKVKIDTILYLHRISDPRMTGSLLKNLKLFVSLCGIQAMPSVHIVTTMWQRVTQEEGESREKSLKDKMWFDMMEKGCTVERFKGTYESALEILKPKPNSIPNHPQTSDHSPISSMNSKNPLLSTEMVEQKKKLKVTAAGTELKKEIKNLVKQRKAASLKLQQLSRESASPETRRIVAEELDEANMKIKTANEQLVALRRNLVEWLFGPRPENSPVPKLGSINQEGARH